MGGSDELASSWSEIGVGVGLFVGVVTLVYFLRPPRGSLQERAINSFPGVGRRCTSDDLRVWLVDSPCRSRARLR